MERGKRQHEDEVVAGPSHLATRQKTYHQDTDRTLALRNDASMPPVRYTIAWICALPVELAAAHIMLDEVHEPPPRLIHDSNHYTLGRIKHHNIVVACLPIAQYGTNNAAIVLTNLLRTFPSVSRGLMVGIGGGAPSKADIRLGDIVVGTRVMQSDLGKMVGDGQFHNTAFPRTLDPFLGKVLTALRTEHDLRSSRVSSILDERLKNYPDYHRPLLPDRLFNSTYNHPSPVAGCDECDHSELEKRSQRKSDDAEIHYGAIASGNYVMKSGIMRDIVAGDLDVICFEMESAGLMDILPCIPIRGICDYADTHKSKEWQKFAAVTAAAYARELLEMLPSDEVGMNVAEVSNHHESNGK
jgi:nucleoside phosphorylase